MGKSTKTKYEIDKQLTLSTAHMPRWLAELMDDAGNSHNFIASRRLCDTIFDSLRYGFRIYAGNSDGDHPIDKFPKPLRKVIKLARKLDCLWVVFDQDGPTYKGLPQWDW